MFTKPGLSTHLVSHGHTHRCENPSVGDFSIMNYSSITMIFLDTHLLADSCRTMSGVIIVISRLDCRGIYCCYGGSLLKLKNPKIKDNFGSGCRMSIAGRKITNLRFADDIDGITGEEDELTKLVHNLDTAAGKFGMEISAEKTKIMTNNDTLQRYITIKGQKWETVDHFKYLAAIICDEGSTREVLSRADQTMTALARLKTNLERQQHQNKTQNKTNARPGHNNKCM